MLDGWLEIDEVDPKAIDYFLCGPPVMIKAATEMLTELGVDPAQIAFDEF